jgi:hypothetical protein
LVEREYRFPARRGTGCFAMASLQAALRGGADATEALVKLRQLLD